MKPPARFVTDRTLPPRLALHANSIARAHFPYDRELGLVALQCALGNLAAGDVAHAATASPAAIGSSRLVVGATVKLALITAVSLTGWRVSRQWPTRPSVAAVGTVASASMPAPRLPSVGSAEPLRNPKSACSAKSGRR